MEWLRIPLALAIVFTCAFGTSFLSSAWERRRKRNESVDGIKALLPGHDCGLCGFESCRKFARGLVEDGGDPGLCAPGGLAVEKRLRSALGDARAKRKVAFVHCQGRKGVASDRYVWEGGKDCAAAAALYGGPKECESACLGLGTCVVACPLDAIRVEDGLARVDSSICTGCGICVQSCPKKVLRLVGIEAVWQVACNSEESAEPKLASCKAACTACGECERLSPAWEFSVSGNLARASGKSNVQAREDARLASIAARCPTGAIVRREVLEETAKKD